MGLIDILCAILIDLLFKIDARRWTGLFYENLIIYTYELFTLINNKIDYYAELEHMEISLIEFDIIWMNYVDGMLIDISMYMIIRYLNYSFIRLSLIFNILIQHSLLFSSLPYLHQSITHPTFTLARKSLMLCFRLF